MKTSADITFGPGLTLPRLSLFDMLTVSAERRHLARLSDRELADIGLDRVDAEREAARPFWDLPRR
ncbi:MAG: DUF1127 domain-containing protein [Pseudomonadota bacterium]